MFETTHLLSRTQEKRLTNFQHRHAPVVIIVDAPVKIFCDHTVITNHARDHGCDHSFYRDHGYEKA